MTEDFVTPVFNGIIFRGVLPLPVVICLLKFPRDFGHALRGLYLLNACGYGFYWQ